MNRLKYGFAVVSLTVVACSGRAETQQSASLVTPGDDGKRARIGASIAELERKHNHQVQRLKQVKASVAEAELSAKEAQSEAQYEQCRAEISKAEAQAEAAQAACFQKIATQQQCVAGESRKASGVAVVGCGAALFATVLTGGAAGWSLLGCGGAYAAGGLAQGDCPQPLCAQQDVRGQVLARSKMTGCRNKIGVTLRHLHETSMWFIVTKPLPDRAAERMGVLKGDWLVRINGTPLQSTSDISRFAEKSRRTGEIHVLVYRDQEFVQLDGWYGELERKLGVQYDPRAWKSDNIAGLRVDRVEDESPARLGGLQVGDVIVQAGGEPVPNVNIFRLQLAKALPGDSVSLLLRDGSVVDVNPRASGQRRNE